MKNHKRCSALSAIIQPSLAELNGNTVSELQFRQLESSEKLVQAKSVSVFVTFWNGQTSPPAVSRNGQMVCECEFQAVHKFFSTHLSPPVSTFCVYTERAESKSEQRPNNDEEMSRPNCYVKLKKDYTRLNISQLIYLHFRGTVLANLWSLLRQVIISNFIAVGEMLS